MYSVCQNDKIEEYQNKKEEDKKSLEENQRK